MRRGRQNARQFIAAARGRVPQAGPQVEPDCLRCKEEGGRGCAVIGKMQGNLLPQQEVGNHKPDTGSSHGWKSRRSEMTL